MKLQRLLYGLCAFFFFPALCLAHPHVFVDCTLTLVFDTNGLSGIKEQWVFDEMFSSTILQDFDKDKNSLLDSQEIADIKKGAFLNLKNFNYFNHIIINGGNFSVKFVTDFFAEVRENHLIYTFFIPCHIKANPHFKTIRLAVYDETYYTDIAVTPELPSIEGGKDLFFVQCSTVPAHDLTFYYGQIVPEAIFLKFKNK